MSVSSRLLVSPQSSQRHRVAKGKVVMEVGGGGLRHEIASQGAYSTASREPSILTLFPVLKLAAAKMSVLPVIVGQQ